MKQIFIFSTLFFLIVAQAQIIEFNDDNFKVKLLEASTNSDIAFDADGNNITIDINNDGEVQVSEAEQVFKLVITGSGLTDVSEIGYFTNLIELDLNNNNLTEINISENQSISKLYIYNNNLSEIGLSDNQDLKELGIYGNNLSEIDVSNNIELVLLNLADNNLSEIDVSNNHKLALLSLVSNELITEIDVTKCPLLSSLQIPTENLRMLYMKNGKNEQMVTDFGSWLVDPINYGENLEYICVDDNQTVIGVITEATQERDIVINSYCSFTPGGESYAIQGNAIFDSNNDGICNVDDRKIPNLKFDITNQEIYGAFYAQQDGNYLIPVQEGQHTITPSINNNFFTVSPNSFAVDFPNNTSPFVQDICVLANGEYNDIEVSLIPLMPARPGFEAHYKLLYKNKGSRTVTGSLSLDFNGDLIVFNLSQPPTTNTSASQLAWEYENLLPFEEREIFLKFMLNTSTDAENPLNDGDVLNFVATVNPTENDETPEDNISELNQGVVNSYDPNDKTCLEGGSVSPELVGKYVHYLIRFENTGTANAVNIVVKGVINTEMFDVSTLVPLDGSHNFETRIKNDNEVEFIFQDIQLPFDDENNDGYVNFKIKTLENLEVGDVFENNAEIYFDYNHPIVTNTATTAIENLSVRESQLKNIQISVYPNPMTDVLNIRAKSKVKYVQFFDVGGKLVFQTSFVGDKQDAIIDVSGLSKGVYFITVETINGIAQRKVIK